jgi:hypothetical protein
MHNCFFKPNNLRADNEICLNFLGSESVGPRETGGGACRHDIENTSQIGAK